MSKQVYISADYAADSGDRNVVEILNGWAADPKRALSFVDMAKVVSGSISKNSDCRICDLKAEFNRQINASSAVIFVVGDKTACRTAGSKCDRNNEGIYCTCTPYKHNTNGERACKIFRTFPSSERNVSYINKYSYLRHEFEQAKKAGKRIIIVYNSLREERTWLPSYMKEYEHIARPFWKRDILNNKVGDYQFIKEALS